MTWFKVDDSFHSHPKVMAASPAALGLWVVAGSWSSMTLTEGHIPAHVLPRLMPKAERLARELVSVGLWNRVENGFQFHDWTSYNPTRSEAVAARERQSSGGAIGNHRRWHEAKGKVDPHCRYCRNTTPSTDRVPDQVTDGGTDSVPTPPSRPDPTRSKSTTPPPSAGPPKGADTTRGTRLPEPFLVNDDMKAWAAKNAPSCGSEDHEAFCDHWRAQPGAKGRKVDWPATWRNWMRREQKARTGSSPARRSSSAKPGPDERAAQIQALKGQTTVEDALNDLPDNVHTLIRGEIA